MSELCKSNLISVIEQPMSVDGCWILLNFGVEVHVNSFEVDSRVCDVVLFQLSSHSVLLKVETHIVHSAFRRGQVSFILYVQFSNRSSDRQKNSNFFLVL